MQEPSAVVREVSAGTALPPGPRADLSVPTLFVKKMEPSFTAAGNVNWYNHYGK